MARLDAYIQQEYIVDNFGAFENTGEFYASYGSKRTGHKQWFFRQMVRDRMNTQVRQIRAEKG